MALLQIDIAVHHGRPCKLVPGHLPSSVAVSNSGGANQRKIVQNLRLKLQDEHGNDCFDGALSGLIKVCLQGQASDPRANSRDVPTFEGGQRSVTLPLHAGMYNYVVALCYAGIYIYLNKWLVEAKTTYYFKKNPSCIP